MGMGVWLVKIAVGQRFARSSHRWLRMDTCSLQSVQAIHYEIAMWIPLLPYF